MNTPKPPDNSNHACIVGITLGLLLKHGITAESVFVPETYDYSSTLKITDDDFGEIDFIVLPHLDE